MCQKNRQKFKIKHQQCCKICSKSKILVINRKCGQKFKICQKYIKETGNLMRNQNCRLEYIIKCKLHFIRHFTKVDTKVVIFSLISKNIFKVSRFEIFLTMDKAGVISKIFTNFIEYF